MPRPRGLVTMARVITFGQTARCDAADELALAVAAGVTSVICQPELVAAALDLGLVPLRETTHDGGGVPHTGYAIQPTGELSAAAVDAAIAPTLREASSLSAYPLVTVQGNGEADVRA